MKWNNSDFSRHYINVRIEGISLENFLTQCMQKGLAIRAIHYVNETMVHCQVGYIDFPKLQEFAGRRYKLVVLKEGGYRRKIQSVLRHKALLVGCMIFIGLFVYQSLFIAEIQVNGYRKINEPELRAALEEIGFYEGCRKNVDLTKVKLHLYDTFDTITWVGIKYRGNLAQVTIAENGVNVEKKEVDFSRPCDIVAERDGYIYKVFPTQGVRAVEDGQYVQKGDILISGTVPLQNVAYGTKDENKTESYVHASGTVQVKVPIRLNFYGTSYQTIKQETGKSYWSISVNGRDLTRGWEPYETSLVEPVTIFNIAKPIKMKLQLLHKKEITIKQEKVTEKETKKQVLNEIHQYSKENLQDNVQILNKSLNFTREKNIINIGVTLETLQEIGIEEEIIVDKSNGESKKNDDQRGNRSS